MEIRRSIARTATCLAAVILTVASGTASAVEFSPDKYTVFRGDINGDSYEDIYLKRKDDIVIIPYEIAIPVSVQVDESYVLYGSSSGNFGAPVLNNAVNTGSLTHQNAGVSFGDFNNDGLDDVVIQAYQTGEQSILVTGTSGASAPVILQQFTTINGQDISLDNATITMEDVNNDGYADFVVALVGGGSSTLINVGTGQFTFVAPESVTYDYDALGRLSKVTRVKGGVTTTIEYDYDSAGNRTSRTVGGGAPPP